MEREPSSESLVREITQLRGEVEKLKLEKLDLEIMLENITEHADAIEAELRARNQEVNTLNHQLALANRELEQLANADGLTAIANRRHFDLTLEREWKRLTREKLPISLLLGDIDYFKRYNDTYGHQAGDECLRQVCQAFNNSIKRPSDLAARYGGEEIAAILPNTDSIGAMHVGREIRHCLHELAIEHSASPIAGIVTLSLGVATLVPTSLTKPTLLVNQADTALYKAKKLGRDRMVLFHKSL